MHCAKRNERWQPPLRRGEGAPDHQQTGHKKKAGNNEGNRK